MKHACSWINNYISHRTIVSFPVLPTELDYNGNGPGGSGMWVMSSPSFASLSALIQHPLSLDGADPSLFSKALHEHQDPSSGLAGDAVPQESN